MVYWVDLQLIQPSAFDIPAVTDIPLSMEVCYIAAEIVLKLHWNRSYATCTKHLYTLPPPGHASTAGKYMKVGNNCWLTMKWKNISNLVFRKSCVSSYFTSLSLLTPSMHPLFPYLPIQTIRIFPIFRSFSSFPSLWEGRGGEAFSFPYFLGGLKPQYLKRNGFALPPK